MIVIEKEMIDNIPTLNIATSEHRCNMLPTVIFVHGFTSIKETNLNFAYFLAEKGYRVILPEALHHGERGTGKNEMELSFHFWAIVIQTITELDRIRQVYTDKGLVDPGRVGVAGTSMGGIITLGALSQYDWIQVAVSLMGNPAYEKFALWQLNEIEKTGTPLPLTNEDINQLLAEIRKYDLSVQSEKLNGRPLLFWHGERDPIVPFDGAYHFYESIRQSYSHTPEKLSFISDKHAGHKVSQAGVQNAVEWFEKHL
jgi:uncharacterized protein